MMRFRGTALLAVLAMISFTLLLTPPPSESSHQLTPQIPQTISYDSGTLSWPGAIISIESGDIGNNDECTFQDSGSGLPSPTNKGQVTIFDTIALDTTSCTRTIATATYPVNSIPDSVWENMDPQAAQLIATRTLPVVRQILPNPLNSWTGSLAVTVHDPLNLTITQTLVNLDWSGTDTEVTSWEPSFSDSWAQWSGWSRYAGRFDVAGGNEQYAYATTSAYYRNDLFCPGRTNTTYSSHWITYFQGEAGGGCQWRRSLSYSGGCSWMLHDTVTLVTP